MDKNNYHILSLGGSLIVPDERIDWRYLKKLRALVLSQIKNGHRFFIVTGGGWTCRHYQQAAAKIRIITNDNLDWVGIFSCRLNAELLRVMFADVAHPAVVDAPMKRRRLSGKVIVVNGGWKPGESSDFVAVETARVYRAANIINLSNIDYVYDQDPKKYKNAKKIEKINWSNFREIVGDKWVPGLNKPFDPIASRLAEKLKLQVVIMNGKKLVNLEKCLSGGKFKGTVIE